MAAKESDADIWKDKCDFLAFEIDHAAYKLYYLTLDEIRMRENA